MRSKITLLVPHWYDFFAQFSDFHIVVHVSCEQYFIIINKAAEQFFIDMLCKRQSVCVNDGQLLARKYGQRERKLCDEFVSFYFYIGSFHLF